MATNQLLFWAPRVLGILLVLFSLIFAFDVFDTGYTSLELVFALLMHLIPSLMLAILLILAWRYELIGGIAYLVLGLGFSALAVAMALQEGAPFPWIVNPIAFPLFLIGALFIADAVNRKKEVSK